MLIFGMPHTRFLDAATRSHLFNIVVNAASPAHELLHQDPAGEGGAHSTKYGYTAALPPGGPHAGRYRLVKRVKDYGVAAGGIRVTWYKATHVGENSYTFELITIPKCGICQGTTDQKCVTCNGTGSVADGRMRSPCVACGTNGRPAGWLRCTRCGPNPKIVAGAAVDKIAANWA